MHKIAFVGLLLTASAYGAGPRVLQLNVTGPVHPILVEIVDRALTQAKVEGDSLVLLRLDTPGGLMDASREIVQRIVASPVPVVTYVGPSGARAASAGFFLLVAGDVAAMAPGSNTGAASPVLLGQRMDDVMRRKVENDASAWLRSVTTHRGRNSELAEKAITEAKAFTEKEALDQHLIDLVAPNERSLVAQLDGREITRWDGSKIKLRLSGATITQADQTVRERILLAIADPNIAFLLIVCGILGLYVEFNSPGIVIAGVAGGIAFLLGCAALSLLPVDWTGAGLLCLAVTFFVLEAKFTTHGVLGIGGMVAMVLGALLLVDGPPSVRIHLSTALAVSIPFGLITVFLVSLSFRARKNKAVTGVDSMIHELATAATALQPEGQILVNGEYWTAVSSAPVEVGGRVRITAVHGLRLEVEPWV